MDADAAHLAPVVAAAVDQLARDDALGEDAPLVVDVLQEQVDRGQPLRQAALERVPLARRDDARQQVEREDALGALLVAVDRERDALGQERRDRPRSAAAADRRATPARSSSSSALIVRPRPCRRRRTSRRRRAIELVAGEQRAGRAPAAERLGRAATSRSWESRTAMRDYSRPTDLSRSVTTRQKCVRTLGPREAARRARAHDACAAPSTAGSPHRPGRRSRSGSRRAPRPNSRTACGMVSSRPGISMNSARTRSTTL